MNQENSINLPKTDLTNAARRCTCFALAGFGIWVARFFRHPLFLVPFPKLFRPQPGEQTLLRENNIQPVVVVASGAGTYPIHLHPLSADGSQSVRPVSSARNNRVFLLDYVGFYSKMNRT